jgi:hypothetical protein
MKKSYKQSTAIVELTDQEIGYILVALHSDIDANPEVILPVMAKLGCYLATKACLQD